MEKKEPYPAYAVVILGVAIYFTAVIFRFSQSVELILYLAAYLLIGGKVLYSALRNISRGEVFDENFLMALATLGAFAIGQYSEGIAVVLFYQIGEAFQDLALDRSRRSIQDLMDIRPDVANLKVGDSIMQVAPEEVKAGDIILVKPGERVPLDGKVIEGQSMLDTSALTGESVPRSVRANDLLLSGFINHTGLLQVEVLKEYGESTVSRILDLVQNAGDKKAPTENFITRFARYYTPVVVFIAVVLAVLPPLLTGGGFSEWFYRALIFLVVSCPCALVISVPLSFFGGIGGASKNGILVKGGNYLEALYKADTIVFDKTGTLTKGVFKVTSIVPAGGFTKEQLLEFAAAAEFYSSHPIARSIVESFGREIDQDRVESYEEMPGYGVKAIFNGRIIMAGNQKMMHMSDLAPPDPIPAGTVVYLMIDGVYAGYLLISDETKEDSVKALQGLRKLGIQKLYMLTGDNQAIADQVGRDLQMDQVFGELLPQDKVAQLEELYRQKGAGKLVFVGDGINDAPVLARADVGVAMGGLGSDAAIEAADVVLMTDEPSKLVTAIQIAQRTRGIVWQNIIFALGIKGLVLILGAAGYATIWEAVFADVGVSLIAILNAMRVYYNRGWDPQLSFVSAGGFVKIPKEEKD